MDSNDFQTIINEMLQVQRELQESHLKALERMNLVEQTMEGLTQTVQDLAKTVAEGSKETNRALQELISHNIAQRDEILDSRIQIRGMDSRLLKLEEEKDQDSK